MAEHWVVLAGWIAALTDDVLDRLGGWPVDLRNPSVGQRKCIQQITCRIALRRLLLAERFLATGFIPARHWPLRVGLLSVVGRGSVRPFRTVRPLRSGVRRTRCIALHRVAGRQFRTRCALSRRRLPPGAAVEAAVVAAAGAAALHSVLP